MPDESSPLVGPAGAGRTMPAGKVLAVMLLALSLAALFNSRRFVHAAEGMPLGWRRTTLLAVAKPVDSFAHFLHTDRPRARIDRALGRDVELAKNGGAFEDPDTVLPTASPGISATPGASATPAVGFRDVSEAAPLKLFITGDSMIEFMAPKLLKEAHAVDGESKVEYGTGLVRDDFFDWPDNARKQMAAHSPEAVIIMMGGNDGQGMTLPGGHVLKDGTPEWGAEYQRRATIMMRILTGGGQRHVYWVGMPIAKSARLAHDYEVIDASLRAAAATVPGVTYVDIWDQFAPGGKYSDFVDGKLVRARDGIHLNRDGAARLKDTLLALLERDWKLSS